MLSVGQQPTTALYSSSLLVQEGVSFCLEGIIFSQSRMPQLDKFTYFTQFFWSCLFLFTFYIPICNDGDGVLGISRILKLRNQLVSHRGNNIRSNDPNSLEDILRKGFSTGVSYMYSSLFEVSQWCNAVDLLEKRSQITLISCFGEISGSRGMERNILYLISKSSYSTSSNPGWGITCRNDIMLIHVPHGQGSIPQPERSTCAFDFRPPAAQNELIRDRQRHSYHLVDPSPWPISGSLGALATTVGGVMYMHPFQGGATLLSLGLIFLLYTMFVWWRDVLRESTLEGHHTKVVQLGPRYGSIPFIVSEVMFLFALFRASSHSSLAPTVEIGGIWPPKGIWVLDPREIPFLNTPIPPSSGAAVTWAHHAILAGKEKRAVYALVATVSLALVSTGFQGMEYYQAPSTISDSIYGSTFFLATGFHGFHVIIGTLFSIICGIRQYLGHLTKEHHVGFEAAAWYWHFVDVVRLFPFVSIYWWGGI
ncbi:cytochrome c oxidase subunit 3 [Macadamia integrifolia]|uniref:cytochrome c oxidase subunit 3 n=1 Tax=Macadamia integrifolia TaxID=60698 RepID=UPI001C4F88EA|nr:cytochrome c oxidase subunit 3 [Macadamia integrifolia]